MGEKVKGHLLVIGGAEDKERDKVILRRFVEMSRGRQAARLYILTSASKEPDEAAATYTRVLQSLGAVNVFAVKVESRREANNPELWQDLLEAGGVFFTGGDQLRITSILGGTHLQNILHEAYRQGTVIAGTSAGAAVMSDVMIVSGEAEDASRRDTVSMAPGMGFLEEVVIDQHFAQRGRINRLVAAIAQNPFILGLGIDEDTAITVSPQGILEVIGSGALTVIDGWGSTHTNASEQRPNEPLAITDMRLHVLPAGYQFDLKNRSVILA